jgi:uncharacterized membrane protein
MRALILVLMATLPSLGQGAPAKTLSEYALTDCGRFTPTHINKAGQIVGWALAGGISHLMLCDESGARDVGAGGPADGVAQRTTPAINDRGDIVGVDAAGGFVRYADGQRISLGSLVPTAINTGRQLVGYMPVGSVNHAVLWQNGMIMDIGLLLGDAAVPSAALDISEDGVVVGYFGPNENDTRGFVYYGGIQIIPYSTPAGRVYPVSVNNVGQVLGYWGVSGRIHPFVWENGILTPLQDQMGLFSMALSINDRGQVAGYAPGELGGEACIWIGATQYNVSSLIQPNGSDSWILRGAWGINVHGQIAASAADSAGNEHAVLLTPLKRKK